MTAIWLSRSVPGTTKIYTARRRDPIALTAAYIAHTGAPKPDAQLHLPHCRRWHDPRRRGAGPPRGRPRGPDRPDQRRAAYSLRPASALESPLEGRARREDLAEDGPDGEPAAPGEAGLGARVFPADLAAFLVGYYREKGVTMRMGEGMAGLDRRAGSCVVRTTLGGELVAEVLVAGLGIVPGVELAEQAGLRVDNGIVVDEACRTSQIDIYAPGDGANFANPALSARLRVEPGDNANTMGRTAGLNMAGPATPHPHLSVF